MTHSTSVLSPAAAAPVYTDINGLAQLRNDAKQDPQEALKAVAKQFEALFLQMALKSMRQASMGDPIFDSSQGDMYRDMFDKQVSLSMSQGQGIGMADALIRQMQRYIPQQAESEKSTDKPPASVINGLRRVPVLPQGHTSMAEKILPAVSSASMTSVTASVKNTGGFETPEQFVSQLLPLAEQAASQLGVKAEVLLAQSALETGWGKYISRDVNGNSSYNLFNIKADGRWQGDVVNKQTLEFKQGVAVRENASFRAYSSYKESFNDYVKFLRNNPRYADALQHSGDTERFVRELHGAGYATDPDYADKILNIMQRGVNEFKLMAAKTEPGVTG